MGLMTGDAIKDALTKVLEGDEQLKGYTLGWVGMSRFALGATNKRFIIIPISAFLGRPKEPSSIALSEISNVKYERGDNKDSLPTVGMAKFMPEFPEATFSFTTPQQNYSYKILKIAGVGNVDEAFDLAYKLYNALKK